MRVCQFRHDGTWTASTAARMPPHQEDLHFYFTDRLRPVKLPRDFTGDDVIGSEVIEGDVKGDVIGGMPSERGHWKQLSF